MNTDQTEEGDQRRHGVHIVVAQDMDNRMQIR